jgi:hypothetical protein
MKHIIYVAILTLALLLFGRQQSVAQGADAAAEQEVRQTIEKYRTALLQRDAATLEQIWIDDYTRSAFGLLRFFQKTIAFAI